jgi:hypothetical protein
VAQFSTGILAHFSISIYKNKTNYSLYYLLKKERKMRGNLYPIIVDTNERAVRGIDGTVIKSWLFQIICFTLF